MALYYTAALGLISAIHGYNGSLLNLYDACPESSTVIDADCAS